MSIETHLLYIDSINRNVQSYPNVNNFYIELDDNFKNIERIELVSMSLPVNSNAIYAQGSLLVQLQPVNLNRVKVSKNSNVVKSAFVVFPKLENASNSFAVVDTPQSIDFPSPQNIMRRFGLGFYKSDGTLYSFGESAGDLTILNNVKALFKIVCKTEVESK